MIISRPATCEECRDGSCAACKAHARKVRARANRKAREDAMRSLGLTKVKGARGGTYWE